MNNKYITLHGHFYQPPRENPWLEVIEHQDSAYPYKDWNERITAECYMPNTGSRILNAKGEIVDIVNNYSRMSFNFGPTLLSWMERNAPRVYSAVLKADQISRERFSGHGSAIAQVYNHIIMPLANERDKRTQVYWGLYDFESRFKRKPEGMWLAETAVDTSTLEILADYGIKFTILSPHQAAQVRHLNHEEWFDVSGGKIDPKFPYLCRLPSGRTISLFFYDGYIAQSVAFGGLLKNGEDFYQRLMSAFPEHADQPLLEHVATDGETYGHHQKFGNMALAYVFNSVEQNKSATITIYGEFLEKFPPVHEARIIENSSWSCMHGIERWRSDCGCHTGGQDGWNQKWRKGLRNAMDLLRDQLAPIYEQEMKAFVSDPWELRDKYIEVILDRRETNVNKFLGEYVSKGWNEQDRKKILSLLEMQRQTLLMYTSCGWFFDEISGIETKQIIQYAARAIQISKTFQKSEAEKIFLKELQKAHSNISLLKNAKQIYNTEIKPDIIELDNVGIHHAISLLFQDEPSKGSSYYYSLKIKGMDKQAMGKQRLMTGQMHIQSLITYEEEDVDFAILHIGGHNLNAGVKEHNKDKSLRDIQRELRAAFAQNDIPKVMKRIANLFGHQYTLWDLFKNEQGEILNKIMEDTLASIDKHFQEIYDQYYPLMKIRKDIRIELPKALAMTVEFVLNRDLRAELQKDIINLGQLEKLIGEIKHWGFMRDNESIGLTASATIERLMEQLMVNPEDVHLMGMIESSLRLMSKISLPLDLWKAQNTYFLIGKGLKGSMARKAQKNNQSALFWLECFDKLGVGLDVKVASDLVESKVNSK